MRTRPNRRAIAVLSPAWDTRMEYFPTLMGWSQFLDGLRRRRGLKPEDCSEMQETRSP